MSEASLWSLPLVMAIAALAPIVSRLVLGRPPQVLFLIVGGVVSAPAMPAPRSPMPGGSTPSRGSYAPVR